MSVNDYISVPNFGGAPTTVKTLTDSAVPTTGITTQNLNPNSGTATAGSVAVLPSLSSVSTVTIQVTGTYTGVLTPQGNVDGANNWGNLSFPGVVNLATGVYSQTIPSGATGIYQCPAAGLAAFRISANAAVTGTAVVSLQASMGGLGYPIVTGTFWQATQPVSGTVAVSGVVATTAQGSVNINVSMTVTAGPYLSGQVCGGIITIPNAARLAAGSGTIQTAIVNVKTVLTAGYDVIFFNASPSNGTYTDNVAYSLNTTDDTLGIGVAHANDLIGSTAAQQLQATNLGLPFKLPSGTSLFAIVVIRGGQTFASTSALNLTITVLQD